jgi:LuxR family maltose regulon positive regulatory protein
VALAHGVAIARQGRLEEAEPHLEMALKYWGIPADTLPRAHTLLCLAPVVAANGDLERARRLTLEARSILAGCPNAGSLPQLLGQVERGLNIRLKRTIRGGEMPSEAEIRVLRLLAGPLTQGAIANELYLSHDTVKTHVKAIYRRLGVASRNEAVERSRDLGII